MFEEGQKVKAKFSTQGLTAGNEYIIREVEYKSYFFGTFATYYLEDDNEEEYTVENGHFVLSETN